MKRQSHWEGKYAASELERVGWYRPRLDASLELIGSLKLPSGARIFDVGGGASTLIDDLLAEGFTRPTVIDVSPRALEIARRRLGERARRARWWVGDILEMTLPAASCDLWHDRAVFHFLTDPADRQKYVEQACRALVPGGHLVIGAFARAAPDRCSGLPVVRYDADSLAAFFTPTFRLVATRDEAHQTPTGTPQPYVFCLLRYCPVALDPGPG